MAAELIVFPRNSSIPNAAIEDEIERLIAILDERQAAYEDFEPDPDLEEAGDAETEAWPEWRPARVFLIGPRLKPARRRERRSGCSSGEGK